MKITRMTATFGALEGETLTPGSGLTVITAPNEGGKSTWAGFLRAMLYGIDTRDRDKKGYLADKNRYQPWSGAPMEGELSLLWQGREILLRRSARGSAPFARMEGVDAASGEPVEALTADSAGPLLVGCEREVYERSAFIGQGQGLAITPVPELERRIAALVTTGQEGISYSQAQNRLKEWLRRRKHNKTGLIPQLEGELEEITALQRRLEGLNARLYALEGEERELQRRQEELEQELEGHRLLALAQVNTRYQQASEELEQALGQLEQLTAEKARYGVLPPREQLKRAQGELAYLDALEPEIIREEQALLQAEQDLAAARAAGEDPRFPGMTAQEAVLQAQKDASAIQTLEERGKAIARKKSCAVVLWAALTAGAFLCLSTPALASVFLIPLVGAQAILCGGLIWGYRADRERRESIGRILGRYGAVGAAEILSMAADYSGKQGTVEQAAELVRGVRRGLADHRARRDNGREGLLSLVRAFAPEVTNLFGCSAALSRCLTLEDRLSECERRTEGARRLVAELRAQGGGAPLPEGLPGPRLSKAEASALLSAIVTETERVRRERERLVGEQGAVGDPALLAARREKVEDSLARRRTEYAAIEAALAALDRANAQLRQRFSPQLNRLAGEYFARLTGGRYRDLYLDREMEATATQDGALLPRRALALSQGTVDQLYLAVRLAVCDLCLPGGEDAPPLVLDDALATFDDGRMALTLELLAQLGQTRQILLFTCQSREGAYCADMPGVTCISREKRD